MHAPAGFGLVMAPRSGSSYAVFEACGARGDLKTRLIRVGPVRLTGADAVRFEAAWPVPGQPPLPGGGGLPPAVTADAVVDGVEVVYEVAGHRYSDIADVTLGICATEVEGRRSEHCR